MSTPNPLVAKAPAEPSGFFNAGTGDNGWATGFSIADSAMDAYKGTDALMRSPRNREASTVLTPLGRARSVVRRFPRV